MWHLTHHLQAKLFSAVDTATCRLSKPKSGTRQAKSWCLFKFKMISKKIRQQRRNSISDLTGCKQISDSSAPFHPQTEDKQWMAVETWRPFTRCPTSTEWSTFCYLSVCGLHHHVFHKRERERWRVASWSRRILIASRKLPRSPTQCRRLHSLRVPKILTCRTALWITLTSTCATQVQVQSLPLPTHVHWREEVPLFFL